MSKKYSWGLALLACTLAVGWLLGNTGVANAADNFPPGAWNFVDVGIENGIDPDSPERNTDNMRFSKLAPWPKTDGRYFYSGGYQSTIPGSFLIVDTKVKENPEVIAQGYAYDLNLSPPPPPDHPIWDSPAFDYTNDPYGSVSPGVGLKAPCGDWIGWQEGDPDPEITCWDRGWITRTHFTGYGTGKVLVVNSQRNSGSSPNRIGWTGISTWDIHDPKNPTLIGRWVGPVDRQTGILPDGHPYEGDPSKIFLTGIGGVHHLFYDGRYAYLGSEYKGFNNRILVIVDVHDPKNPVEVGKYNVPGQEDIANADWVPGTSFGQPILIDPLLHPTKLKKYVGLHYVSVYGNIAYLSYHHAGLIILDVTKKTTFDPITGEGIKFLSRLDYLTPEFQAADTLPNAQDIHETCQAKNAAAAPDGYVGCGNAHSARIVPGAGGLLAMTDEYGGCPHGSLRLIDVSNPAEPFIISHHITPPLDGETLSRTLDCSKTYTGSGPGTHLPLPINNNLLFIAHYGAGVRAVDISDPYNPVEVGYYHYANPLRGGGMDTYDVIEGAGGLFYVSDRQDGVRVLRYTGTGKSGKSGK